MVGQYRVWGRKQNPVGSTEGLYQPVFIGMTRLQQRVSAEAENPGQEIGWEVGKKG